jgi:cell envelope opacity-associated protein A
MYEPHQSYNDELSISNKNQYSKLLTADQKIQELEQLMEARDLEREEMKVQLEALQTYKTKGTQPVEPAQFKQMSKDMNSKLNHVNISPELVLSSLSDLNSVQTEIAPNYHSGKLLQVQSKMTEISRILSNMSNTSSLVSQPPHGPS